MAKVKFSRTEDTDITSIPITDGQLIYTKSGKCYLDYGDERVEIVTGGDTVPIGFIATFAEVDEHSTLMDDWILCDGRELSRSEYSALYSVIGTKYGAGDGVSTFNVPKIDGRNLVGLDLTDEDFNEVGKTGGSKTHTQTVDEMPSHGHKVPFYTSDNAGGYQVAQQVAPTNTIERNTTNTGGGQPMDIMNPYVVVKFYIKAFRSASVTALVKNTRSRSETDVYSCNYVNNMRKVLWTNPNPSQEMGADVLINLSSDDYDELEWVCAYSTSNSNNFSVSCLKGNNILISIASYTDGVLLRRIIDRVSDTQYKTQVAKRATADTSAHVIPIKVIGVKNT